MPIYNIKRKKIWNYQDQRWNMQISDEELDQLYAV